LNKNIKDLNDIKRILSAYKGNLREKYKIKELGVFGSYVRGEQNENSDLDILVSFYEIPSLIKFIEIENYLSDELNIKTDLVRKESIREELKNQILNEAIFI
jgi:uncharacterized protein